MYRIHVHDCIWTEISELGSCHVTAGRLRAYPLQVARFLTWKLPRECASGCVPNTIVESPWIKVDSVSHWDSCDGLDGLMNTWKVQFQLWVDISILNCPYMGYIYMVISCYIYIPTYGGYFASEIHISSFTPQSRRTANHNLALPDSRIYPPVN